MGTGFIHDSEVGAVIRKEGQMDFWLKQCCAVSLSGLSHLSVLTAFLLTQFLLLCRHFPSYAQMYCFVFAIYIILPLVTSSMVWVNSIALSLMTKMMLLKDFSVFLSDFPCFQYSQTSCILCFNNLVMTH